MPPRIQNEIVDIALNGVTVKGILDGDENKWSFQSLNKQFLALFADGIVNSFTYLGVDSRHYEHHRCQLAIAAYVKDLLEERHTNGKRQKMATVNAVRRFVAP